MSSQGSHLCEKIKGFTLRTLNWWEASLNIGIAEIGADMIPLDSVYIVPCCVRYCSSHPKWSGVRAGRRNRCDRWPSPCRSQSAKINFEKRNKEANSFSTSFMIAIMRRLIWLSVEIFKRNEYIVMLIHKRGELGIFTILSTFYRKMKPLKKFI